jgi:methionyl-tRNA formyltransferase
MLLSIKARALIGVINRHNALLPKNRGRLTPFWVLYKGEKETGVSIHFIDEGIDSG